MQGLFTLGMGQTLYVKLPHCQKSRGIGFFSIVNHPQFNRISQCISSRENWNRKTPYGKIDGFLQIFQQKPIHSNSGNRDPYFSAMTPIAPSAPWQRCHRRRWAGPVARTIAGPCTPPKNSSVFRKTLGERTNKMPMMYQFLLNIFLFMISLGDVEWEDLDTAIF